MKRRDFIRTSSALGAAPFLPTQEFASPLSKRPNAGQPTIFVTGGSSDDSMMKFFISLTGKENPKDLPASNRLCRPRFRDYPLV
jgi:hypothetical protein